jgi:biuret amidohydrolase
VSELAELVDPAHTVLVTQECQNGAVGAGALWPPLAASAAAAIPNIVRLAEAARAVSVPVVHCVSARREDLAGSNRNAPLFAAARRSGGLRLNTPAVDLIDELGPEASDVVITKLHGVSPMYRTGLDAILRELGVETIVATGVSVNVAIWSLAMDAVNAGYRVVVPRDAVAGVPPSYADAVLQHSLALLATVVTTADIGGLWT